jgi:hypothetical protein
MFVDTIIGYIQIFLEFFKFKTMIFRFLKIKDYM